MIYLQKVSLYTLEEQVVFEHRITCPIPGFRGSFEEVEVPWIKKERNWYLLMKQENR